MGQKYGLEPVSSGVITLRSVRHFGTKILENFGIFGAMELCLSGSA